MLCKGHSGRETPAFRGLLEETNLKEQLKNSANAGQNDHRVAGRHQAGLLLGYHHRDVHVTDRQLLDELARYLRAWAARMYSCRRPEHLRSVLIKSLRSDVARYFDISSPHFRS